MGRGLHIRASLSANSALLGHRPQSRRDPPLLYVFISVWLAAWAAPSHPMIPGYPPLQGGFPEVSLVAGIWEPGEVSGGAGDSGQEEGAQPGDAAVHRDAACAGPGGRLAWRVPRAGGTAVV